LEPIRDSLLAIAGQLDRRLGGQASLEENAQYANGELSKSIFDAPRRTLYLPINRAALEPIFSTFDYVDPAVSLETRPSTIVPHQTLFLMNHPLVMDSGRALAASALRISADDQACIERIYKTVFARFPSDAEVAMALRFIEQNVGDGQSSEDRGQAWVSFCRSLLLTNEFLYVD
jgi:hypothetical protein